MQSTTSERWRQIPGSEGLYEVSDQGRVRSWHPYRGTPVPRLIKTPVDGKGYPEVGLHSAGHRETKRVHNLVLEAFVGPCPEGMETRHLDGDPENNALSNLAYGTRSENQQDALRHATNHFAAKTRCPYGHPYAGENLYIRPSDGNRGCRTCNRTGARRRMRAHRARDGATR